MEDGYENVIKEASDSFNSNLQNLFSCLNANARSLSTWSIEVLGAIPKRMKKCRQLLDEIEMYLHAARVAAHWNDIFKELEELKHKKELYWVA